MGFVRLNVITNDIAHGVRYATKYLLKEDAREMQKKPGRINIRPYVRLFTASRGSLEKDMKKKKKYKFGQVVFGRHFPGQGWHEQEIDALPIKDFMREALSPLLQQRILTDENLAIYNLLKKTKVAA